MIATSAVVVAVVGLVYLHGGPTLLNRKSAPTLSPSPQSLSTAWNGVCPPTELKLTGVFEECAAIDKGQSCPAGSFDQARVILLHGTVHDFLLYIEVNGAYHGPGIYAFAPWPHSGLGVPDGVAKVAVRAYITGSVPTPTPSSPAIGVSEEQGRGLWESTAGSVTINKDEESGWVYAGLGASSNSPVNVGLNIAGWWSCS